MTVTKTELILAAQSKGFEAVEKQVTAIASSLDKLANKKYTNTGFTKFTAELAKGFNSLKVEADKTRGAINSLTESLDKLGSKGGGRFGGRLEMEGGLKGYLADMEKMLMLQARWYGARAVLFAAVEAPIAAVREIGKYILEVDKARAEMMRWGATSGKVTKQLGDDADLIVTQIRKATLEFPVLFADLSKSAQAFVGAGIDPRAVARMVPDIARMQTAFKEIDFNAFAVALTGTLNVFKSSFKGVIDEAEVLSNIIDKLMKAQATGIIRPEQFTVVMQYMSQIGSLSGFTLDQILALAVAITDTGIRAQSASRLMASLMLTLQTPKAIKQLHEVGIEIDRNRDLASQFNGIIEALGKKIGSGPASVGWLGWMTQLVGKEQAKDMLTIITRLEKYKQLIEAIAGSQGGLLAAAEVMKMPISDQWIVILNVFKEIGKGVAGGNAVGVLQKISTLTLEIANGMLAAADATGKFSKDVDKLGTVGQTVKVLFEHLKTILEVIGSLLVIKIIKSIGETALKFGGLHSAILGFLKGPLFLLTIGLAAVNELFRQLNSEMDKIEKRDTAFANWFQASKTPDLEKGLGDRARRVEELGRLIEREEELQKSSVRTNDSLLVAVGKGIGRAITGGGEPFNLERLEQAKKELATTLFEIDVIRGGIRTRVPKPGEPTIAGQPPPPVEERDYSARMRELLMRQLKIKLDAEEHARKISLDALEIQYRTEGMLTEEYTTKKDKIVSDSVKKQQILISSTSDVFEEYYLEEAKKAEDGTAKRVALDETYATIKLELTKMLENKLAEMAKAGFDKTIRDYDSLKKEITQAYDSLTKSILADLEKIEADEKVNFAQRKTTSADYYSNMKTLAEGAYSRGEITSSQYFDQLENLARDSAETQIRYATREAEGKLKVETDKLKEWGRLQTQARDEMLAQGKDYTDKEKEDREKAAVDRLTAFIKETDTITRTREEMIFEIKRILGQGLFGIGVEKEQTPSEVFKKLGAVGTFNEYFAQSVKDFSNWGLQLKNAADEIAKGIQSSFEDFFFDVMKEEFKSLGESFKNLGNLVLRIIARIMSEQLVATITPGVRSAISIAGAAIVNYIGGGGSVVRGSTSSAVAHAGGKIGVTNFPMRFVPSGVFANAPRYHSGLAGNELPAILQRGETVLPKGSSLGPKSVVVNIKNETGTPVESKNVKIDFDLEKMVVGIILKNKASNGPLRYA